ncbi:MAG: hypothetical protein K1X83_12545 [Oligoflexia bacterium]|nr:hypothetical protein [Oligoflexia bacterium]
MGIGYAKGPHAPVATGQSNSEHRNIASRLDDGLKWSEQTLARGLDALGAGFETLGKAIGGERVVSQLENNRNAAKFRSEELKAGRITPQQAARCDGILDPQERLIAYSAMADGNYLRDQAVQLRLITVEQARKFDQIRDPFARERAYKVFSPAIQQAYTNFRDTSLEAERQSALDRLRVEAAPAAPSQLLDLPLESLAKK